MSCILSTMRYICNLAISHRITPILSFDQPLFWKASIIANDKRFNSEFHMLVDCAPTSMLLSDDQHEQPIKNITEEIQKLYTDVVHHKKSLSDVKDSESLRSLQMVLTEKIDDHKNASLTIALWCEYKSTIALTRKLVQADRTGSWALHLHAIREFLPVFAAAGHINYLKSAYLYLQTMQKLTENKPDVYDAFQNGFHVAHRTGTAWSGLGSDLVIEQVLMRSIKSSGGLTRGSGLSESMRGQWVLSMPASCNYSLAMQALTRTAYFTSEQHKGMHCSRQIQDRQDGEKVLNFLQQYSPFTFDPTLRNIVTGRTFDTEVTNVNTFRNIGEQIVMEMIGKDVFSFSCKRKDRAQTLALRETIRWNKGDNAAFDPGLLFQRLIVAANNVGTDLEELLKHELCPYPPSLFDSSYLLRKGQKSAIAHTIHKIKASGMEEPMHQRDITEDDHHEDSTYYVLDGGYLLHRVSWSQGCTFDEIASSYADFISKKYRRATTVFDGYSSSMPTIKDNEHHRRGVNSRITTTVHFNPQNTFTGKKENFLLNTVNKTQVTYLIGQHLEKVGCKVIFGKDDADVLIVREAVKMSACCNTVIIGEDTDLLILLLYHATDTSFSLHFRSDISSKKSSRIIYNIFHIRKNLGEKICNQLLFLHAFTGCDSTSYIHNIGKASAFNKLLNIKSLSNVADTFCDDNMNEMDIEVAGRNAMLLLYGARKSESLLQLRVRIFKEKVASHKTFVKPESLPPTESAVKFHSLRCYYQIMKWKFHEYDEDACKWGWYVKDNKYFPKTSNIPPAPKSLLSIIRCKCSKTCETLRCSCKKIGLPCTDVCGTCQENGCQNMSHSIHEVDLSSEDSDTV